MKKLLTILLILFSFSTFAQFEAGEFINTDTVKLDGVPLLMNTFKKDSLGGAGNIFYSTGASSQPASGSLNQVIANNLLNPNVIVKWDGTKFANSGIIEVGGNVGIGTAEPQARLSIGNSTAGSRRLLYIGEPGYPAGDGANAYGLSLYGNSSDGVFKFYGMNSGVETVAPILAMNRITGNVGIGTTSPGAMLDIQAAEAILALTSTTGVARVYQTLNNTGGTLWLGRESSAGNLFGYGAYSSFLNSGGAYPLVFGVNGQARLTILSGGNVGLTTTDPSERLDVNGNAIADVLKSRVATGTAPLVVASTTVVDSLNAGLLDGKHASDFQLKSDTLTFDATISDLNDSTAAIRALANTKATISGTDNFIMKKTGDNTLGNSLIYESEGQIGVATTEPRALFDVPVSSIIGNTDILTGGGVIINNRGTGNRYAFIDFKGDDVYKSPFRIIRYNTGEDAISAILHRGKGDFLISTQDAGRVLLRTKNTNALIIDTLQNSGFGTLNPAARIHSQSTTTQLRLGYDATKYTDLTVGSGGNLIINPTGDTVKVVGAVNSTGGFFKNGVEIVGGGGISTIGITVPAGLTVSPASISASDTFAIGLQSGYSIPTTSNQTNWTAGYNYRLISAGATAPLYLSLSGNVLSGSLSSQLTSIGKLTPSTGYLYYNGSTFSYAAGGSMIYPSAGIPVSTGSSWGTSKTSPSGAIVGTTDSQALTNKSINGVTLSTGAGSSNYLAGDGSYKNLSTVSQWTNVTGGILYENGVRIGNNSYTSAKLNVTATDRAIQGESDSSQGLYGGSNSGNGVYGVSSTGVGVYGNSTTGFGGLFEGLGCKATKFYVSSLNTAPASSSATGTTGEIRFTSDYIYVCVATNKWKRTQISTW